VAGLIIGLTSSVATGEEVVIAWRAPVHEEATYALQVPSDCSRRSTAEPAGTSRTPGALVGPVGEVVGGVVDPVVVGPVTVGPVAAGPVAPRPDVPGPDALGPLADGTSVVVGSVVDVVVGLGAVAVEEVTVKLPVEVTTGSKPTLVVRFRFSRMTTEMVGFAGWSSDASDTAFVPP
jgi:hypothetical protein